MAPESLSQHEFKPRPLDVWALGVSIYAFVFGELPFWGETLEAIELEIMNKEINLEDREASNGFKEMLCALLDRNPDTRPTIREAKERFTWLKRPAFPSELPESTDDCDALDQ